jgi:hypothetical protein
VTQEAGATRLVTLARPTTGKGCLYIKKLTDGDQQVLAHLVIKSLAAMQARY